MIRPFTSEAKINEFKVFFETILHKQFNTHSNSTIKKLLDYHNDLYPMNKKHSVMCSACRAIAYTRCEQYYKTLTKDQSNIKSPVESLNEIETKTQTNEQTETRKQKKGRGPK